MFHKFGFLHRISQNWTVPGLNFMPCQNSWIGTFPSAPQNVTAFWGWGFVYAVTFCCTGSGLRKWGFSRCGEPGLLGSRGGFSCWGAQASGHVGCSSCSSRAQLPTGMWNLPGAGTGPMSPALSGKFLTPGPPGKSKFGFLKWYLR